MSADQCDDCGDMVGDFRRCFGCERVLCPGCIAARDDDAGEVWCADCALVGAQEDLRRAARAVLDRLDYLRGLWGDEGVTRTLADGLRDALAKLEATP